MLGCLLWYMYKQCVLHDWVLASETGFKTHSQFRRSKTHLKSAFLQTICTSAANERWLVSGHACLSMSRLSIDCAFILWPPHGSPHCCKTDCTDVERTILTHPKLVAFLTAPNCSRDPVVNFLSTSDRDHANTPDISSLATLPCITGHSWAAWGYEILAECQGDYSAAGWRLHDGAYRSIRMRWHRISLTIIYKTTWKLDTIDRNVILYFSHCMRRCWYPSRGGYAVISERKWTYSLTLVDWTTLRGDPFCPWMLFFSATGPIIACDE